MVHVCFACSHNLACGMIHIHSMIHIHRTICDGSSVGDVGGLNDASFHDSQLSALDRGLLLAGTKSSWNR
jgi:hypothetical protein